MQRKSKLSFIIAILKENFAENQHGSIHWPLILSAREARLSKDRPALTTSGSFYNFSRIGIALIILLVGLSFTQNSFGMERVVNFDVSNSDEASLKAKIIEQVTNMYALGERRIYIQELNGSNLSPQDFSKLKNLFESICNKKMIPGNVHLRPFKVFFLKHVDPEKADSRSLILGESQINFQIKEYYSAEFRKNFYCICIGAGVGIFIIIVLSILSEYLGGNVYSHSDG